jgi:hypothetical protein
MLWLFRKLLDRLATKLMLVAAAKVDSEMEIELGYCRAEMLRAADDLESDSGARGEEIADGLRRRAERLGQDTKGPASEAVELVELLREEDLHEQAEPKQQTLISEGPRQGALPSPAGKKRGRPRKNPDGELENEAVGS